MVGRGNLEQKHLLLHQRRLFQLLVQRRRGGSAIATELPFVDVVDEPRTLDNLATQRQEDGVPADSPMRRREAFREGEQLLTGGVIDLEVGEGAGRVARL